MTTHNHTAIATGAAADASTFNTPLGAIDAAIGNLTTLTTTAKTSAVAAINELDGEHGALASLSTTEKGSIVGAINEVDANADAANAAVAAGRGGQDANLLWDPLNMHVEGTENWAGKSWWEGTASVSIIADSANPYGGKTIRTTTSAKGKGTYLKEIGLAPGDVISAGMMCKAASGTYACRLIFRTSGPGGTALSTPTGTGRTFAGETAALVIENITIPATANWVTICPYSASPTSIDIYGAWLHRGVVAAAMPAPSEFTSTYTRLKEWPTANQQLLVRNVDASNFQVYQPLPDGESWIRWLFTKLATNNWTYYGADMCTDNAGTGAYGVVTFDVGYSIYYTPNGASGETCGNHHLNDNFTVVNFYDSAGNTVDPTAANAVFAVKKLRIEQKGTLRHPDTGVTDHATLSRFIELSSDGIYEHQRLSWLTSSNTVGYWNTGQLLATSANRAWAHNVGDTAMQAADASQNPTATRAYTWYTSRKFAFEVECPTAEAIQLRTGTLKVYPRTIQTDVTRDAGDVDHAEWYWRVIYDKEFAKRI